MLRADSVRGVLLDIEGTTSSIAFVHDVLFPFVLEHLEEFLEQNYTRRDVQSACQQIARDAGFESIRNWEAATRDSGRKLVVAEVRQLMSADVKATGLKTLQGLIWERGFDSGHLAGHVYPDVIPTLTKWREMGLEIRIYSSGSIAAQKMYFRHTASHGDCLALFNGHYDTAIGGKKQSLSYRRIADDWGLQPGDILFISDVADELLAAQGAGLKIAASARPGNAALPESLSGVTITSLTDIEFSIQAA